MDDQQVDDFFDDEEEDDSHECCEDCGCYHGHHPWCDSSEEQNDY